MACYPISFGRALSRRVLFILFFASAPFVFGGEDLAIDEAQGRIESLRAVIAYHDDLYYRKAAPEISDTEYDVLKRELVTLEKKYPDLVRELDAVSGLGDDRSKGFQKARHGVPMLSLDKAYSESELREFDSRLQKLLGKKNIEYTLEPKIDGMAISLVYEKGRFLRAVTRGNGEEGDDVSENILTIAGVPRELDKRQMVPYYLELRGEVFLTFEEFERINRDRESMGEEAFSNPRNLAAGSAKLTDSAEVRERGLSLVVFGYGAFEPEELLPSAQREFYAMAEDWGIPVLQKVRVVRGIEELVKAIDDVATERVGYPFPADGVVVKVSSVAEQVELGSSDYAPRWALAYKFATQRVMTRLEEITLQVGRTGVVTPVAELKPVELSGSRIARASLHNFGVIRDKGIRIGDTVYLEKAGEVIPSILGVELVERPADSVDYIPPEVCPSCGLKLTWSKSGATARCWGATCPAQRLQRLVYFASRQGVDIKGLGEAGVADLLEKRKVKSAADFYRLSAEEAGRWGAAIEASRDADLWRFVNGLSIPGIGEARAKELAAAFGSLGELAEVRLADFEEGGIAADIGFGKRAKEAVSRFFAVEENRMMVVELGELVGK